MGGTSSFPMAERENQLVNWRYRPPLPYTVRHCGFVEGWDWIYRYWDRDGVLLYVGISNHAAKRAAAHRRNSMWWPFVARASVELARKEVSGGVEFRAIRYERPLFNVKATRVSDKLCIEYLAWREAWDLVDVWLDQSGLEDDGWAEFLQRALATQRDAPSPSGDAGERASAGRCGGARPAVTKR